MLFLRRIEVTDSCRDAIRRSIFKYHGVVTMVASFAIVSLWLNLKLNREWDVYLIQALLRYGLVVYMFNMFHKQLPFPFSKQKNNV